VEPGPSAEAAPLETIDFPTATTSLDPDKVQSIERSPNAYYQYRRVKGTFRHDWDMRRYPFDRHRLVIPLDETHLGASVVVFEPDLAASFVTPTIRAGLDDWEVSDLVLRASITEEVSTYGLPDAQDARYARLEAAVDLKRMQLLAFLKLTFGVFAAALIALLSFFFDPRNKDTFSSVLSLLVGVLFAVLVNLRATDATIGDITRLTLVAEIHFVALALIVVRALLALRDRLRTERELPMRYPNWPLLAVTAGLYVLVTAGLVTRAAWS
jgi:hypothetical protein